jgi:hypothetical protein
VDAGLAHHYPGLAKPTDFYLGRMVFSARRPGPRRWVRRCDVTGHGPKY